MRKYEAVFGLYARSSIIKTFLITAGMVVSQLLLTLLRIRRLSEGGMPLKPEEVFSGGGIRLPLLIGFLLLTAALCLPGRAPGAAYTLRRLKIGEKAVFLLQALANAVFYLFLLAAELVLFYALSVWIARAYPSGAGEQAVFLGFYRSELLHSLLPLQDLPLWVRNGLLLIAMSLTTAEVPLLCRQKRYSFSVLPAGALTAVFFIRGLTAGNHVFWAAGLLTSVILKLIYDFHTAGEGSA